MRISDWSSDVCSSDLPEDYYLWVGQLVPYKRPDLVIDAFNANGLPLWVIGDGASSDDLRARAGPNIRFDDRLDYDGLRSAYARAKALIFTAEEDFGIVPVEAMASGRPVIARSEEHTSELQSLMRISYAVFCLKKKQ